MKKLQLPLLSLAMAMFTISVGCSASSGTSGTGGKTGSGGSGTGSGGSGSGTGGSGSARCPEVTACDGSVVGAWTVSTSCLDTSGSIDPGAIGLDPRSCNSATISGSVTVSGTFTATDKAYTDATTTKGTVKMELAAGCLMISGTTTDCAGLGGFIGGGTTCQNAASGGGCSCTRNVDQMGGIGLISAAPGKMDGYTVANKVLKLTTDAGDANYAYCVSGNKLTLSPKSVGIPSLGTIELTKAGGGSGGATGSGGGGNPGSGGAAGTGSGGTTPATGGRGGGSATGGAAGGSATGGRGGSTGTGGSGMGGAIAGGAGPCDIYEAANLPCAAAYSMVRVLNSKYTGFLYQVRKGGTMVTDGSGANMKTGVRGGGTTKDIGAIGGYVDIAAHDAFCDTACTVSKLYDQSGNGNDLTVAKAGGYNDGSANLDDFESAASKGPITVAGGKKSYSLYMGTREGYRLMAKGKGMPTGSAAQGIYELADGTHFGDQCCWDFGNAVTDPKRYANMNTLFFGKAGWGNGAGNGPWFMADFEAGVWAGGSKVGDPGWGALDDAHPKNNANPAMPVPFALGMLKTQMNPSKYALRSADVKTAADMTTSYEGALPLNRGTGSEGGILLGVGGDNSNHSFGTFFEGAIVAGYPTVATDLAILNNIKAVGYSK